MDRATRGRSDGSRWRCVPYASSVATRPRNDVLPIRKVSNRLDMPLERLAGCSTSLGIPGSNGAVVGSGDDVAPIMRVSNGRHPESVPLERIANCGTSLGIPDSNGAIKGSRDDVAPIGRASNGPHRVSVPLERIADCGTSLGIPDSNGVISD